LASALGFRAVAPALVRERANFPYVRNDGHKLLPLRSRVINCLPSASAGNWCQGSGKTVLLLRALDAVPQVVPESQVACIYVDGVSTSRTASSA
jgi:hypothetical protein